MSIEGTMEFAVQIKRFRNLDLYEPGLYNIQIAIFHESGSKRIYARPYSMSERPPVSSLLNNVKPVARAMILDSSSAYVTKTFSINLNDEETMFNDSCYFRSEYQTYPKCEQQNFILEAELQFADYSTYASDKSQGEEKLNCFKPVGTFQAKINNPHAGVHEYVPMSFELRNSSVLDITFHTAISNLRIRAEPSPSLNCFQPNQKGHQEEDELFAQTEKFKTLFTKKGPLTVETLDKFYVTSICPMKKSFRNLLEFYATVLRMYMQESNENIYLKFLEGLPTQQEILELMSQGRKMQFLGMTEEHKISDISDDADMRKISEILSFQDPELLLYAITREMLTLSSNTFHTWRSLNEVMLEVPQLVLWNLQKQYNDSLKESFKERLSQVTYKTPETVYSFDENIGEANNRTAASLRGTISKKTSSSPSVVDLNLFSNSDLQPIVFEEISVKENSSSLHTNDMIFSHLERNCVKNVYSGVHLIVLCHGFQGSSFDLRLLKNTISYLYPDTMILCSSSNEEQTDGEIGKMGIRLASEVKGYIDEWVRDNNLGRLSFIGHSLGGLIIRAALPYLDCYSSKMHLFMTFSSAHLGYMNSSRLIDTGMWLMRQWKRSKCLQELSLADASDLKDSFIFKLSKMEGLNWFKHVVFLSSFQDQYAPYQSARIQITKNVFQDSSKQDLYEEMTNNILSKISTDCLYRIDVNFSINKTNLDSILGRTAHIQFLESQYLLKLLVWRYTNFFS